MNKAKFLKKAGSFSIPILLMFATLQCSQEQQLQLFIDQNSTSVFYGERDRACGALLSETADGPGFVYCGPCLIWKGTEILQLVSLKIEFPVSTQFPAGFKCNIDGDDLDLQFPDRIDRGGTAGSAPYYDGKIYPHASSGGNTTCGIGIVCTGITPTNTSAQFTITGKAYISGVQEATGRLVTSSTRVIFNYFPAQ